jgi:hypothetical protein
MSDERELTPRELRRAQITHARREAERARNRESYRRNRERVLAKAKERREDPAFREARSEYHREWYQENRGHDLAKKKSRREDPETRDHVLAGKKKSYALNKDGIRERQAERRGMSRREWNLQKMYGLSLEDYDRLLAEQDGGCAVCGATESGTYRGNPFLHVDHDHATGEIRGLLCGKCNRMLGQAEDSVDRLMAAAAYLLSKTDVLGIAAEMGTK